MASSWKSAMYWSLFTSFIFSLCSSAVPHGLFPLAIDDRSGMASSFSMSYLTTLLALEGGLLCLHISAGVGSLLSMRAWRSIPWYARCITQSSLLVGHMAVRCPLCIAVSNQTPL